MLRTQLLLQRSDSERKSLNLGLVSSGGGRIAAIAHSDSRHNANEVARDRGRGKGGRDYRSHNSRRRLLDLWISRREDNGGHGGNVLLLLCRRMGGIDDKLAERRLNLLRRQSLLLSVDLDCLNLPSLRLSLRLLSLLGGGGQWLRRR